MRSRTSAHDQAVARRLELLSAELAGARPAADDGSATWIRPVRAGAAPGGGAVAAEPATHDRAADDAGVHDAGAHDAGQAGPVPVPRPGRHARRRGRPGGWLPQAWVERTTLGPGPVAVVAVLAAVGLALACWWLLRAQPEPVHIETTSAGAAPASPVHGGAAVGSGPLGRTEGSDGPAEEIVVDIAGRVRRPGIVVLPTGARVVDALEEAGGVRRGVDLTGLNLARRLVDGEQVLVGVSPPPGAGSSAGSAGGAGETGAGGLLDLNTATSEQLQELPGVGPVTAEAILSFRADHGPFTSVDELIDVRGIGPATLAEISPHLTV